MSYLFLSGRVVYVTIGPLFPHHLTGMPEAPAAPKRMLPELSSQHTFCLLSFVVIV